MKKLLLSLFSSLICLSALSQTAFDENFRPKLLANPTIYESITLSDGKIIVLGDIVDYDGNPVKNVVRINAGGTLDESFNINQNIRVNRNSEIQLTNNGKIYIYTGLGSIGKNLFRFNSDGSLDESFQYNDYTYDFEVLPNGQLLISRADTSDDGIIINKLNEDGSLDESFIFPKDQFESNFVGFSITQDKSSILLSEKFYDESNQSEFYQIVKFNITNLTFELLSNRYENPPVYEKIKEDINGNLLFNVLNEDFSYTLTKALPNGAIDTNFTNTITNVREFELDQDGKIYVQQNARTVKRLNPNGTPDDTFQDINLGFQKNSETDRFVKVSVNANGTHIFGNFSSVNEEVHRNYLITNENGTIDTGFKPSMYSLGNSNAIVNDDLGRLYVGGDFIKVNETDANGIVRFNTDGTIDETFTSKNLLPTRIVYDLVVSNNHTYTIYESPNAANTTGALLKINESGDVVNDFDGKIVSDLFNSINASSIIALPDGSIVVSGAITAYHPDLTSRYRIAKILADDSIDESFNPDNIFENLDVNVVSKIELIDDQIFTSSRNFFGSAYVHILDLNGNEINSLEFPQSNLFQAESFTMLPDSTILVGGGDFNSTPTANKFSRIIDREGNIVSEQRFTHDNYFVKDVLLLRDSTLLWVGQFNSLNNFSRFRIARTDTTGSVVIPYSLSISNSNSYTGERETIITRIHELDNGLLALNGVFDEVGGQPAYGFAIIERPNYLPKIAGVNTPVEANEEVSIDLTDFLVVLDENDAFPDDFTFTVTGNENGYQIDNTTIIPEEYFNGPIEVTVSVNDGEVESNEFVVNINILEVERPVITDITQIDTLISLEQPTALAVANFVLQNPPSEEALAEYSLEILPGANYTIVDNEVIPNTGFVGFLDITVRINDGLYNSQPYTFQIEVSPIAGIPAFLDLSDKISTYPNPSTDGRVSLVLRYPELGQTQVQLFQSNGKLLKSVTLRKMSETLTETIDISSLEPGIYILKVSTSDKLGIKRIIKQ